MKNLKKYVPLAIFVAFFAVPNLVQTAQAAALTQGQISAVVTLLQSFGVDQTTINSVQVALGGTPTNTSTSWCHTFNTDLQIGNSGSEVTALQTALQKEGFSVQVSGTFDEATASAVVGFQEKYAADILTPLGLTHGTGYVGSATRAKLNQLYGCGGGTTNIPPTVIGGTTISTTPTYTISPPSASKKVGETQQFIGSYDPDGSGSQTPQEKTNLATWSSSNTSIATPIQSGGVNINNSGLIFCMASGSITITSVYNGITATAGLTCSTTTTTPSITVLSPNGGKVWYWDQSRQFVGTQPILIILLLKLI